MVTEESTSLCEREFGTVKKEITVLIGPGRGKGGKDRPSCTQQTWRPGHGRGEMMNPDVVKEERTGPLPPSGPGDLVMVKAK